MKTSLASIRRLYAQLEYEQALKQIDRTRRYAREAEDKLALFLYEGILLEELGRTQEAATAFKASFALRPEATLPVVVSPKIGQHFESLRQKAVLEPEPVVTKQEPSPPETEPERQQAPLGIQKQGAPQVLDVTAGIPDARTAEVHASRWTSPRVLVPALAGGVLLAAGGTSWVLARKEQSKLRGDDPSLTTLGAVKSSAARGRTYQVMGVGLLGAGLIGLGVSAGLYMSQAPAAPMALGVTTNGSSILVQGRWP